MPVAGAGVAAGAVVAGAAAVVLADASAVAELEDAGGVCVALVSGVAGVVAIVPA